MRRTLLLAVVLAISLVSTDGTTARQLSADEIMSRGIKHLRVPREENRIRMVLINRQGQRRERVMSLSVATTGSGDRSLALFHYPGGIRGTALLSREGTNGKDTQWLFMPVLGRSRRIATTQVGDSFMGSEMAFEDTKVLRLEDWRFKLLRRERFEGRSCAVIESLPAPGHDTSYGKTITWMDTKLFVALKTVFFDKRGRELKRILARGFRQAAPGVWRPREQIFISSRTKKKTILRFEQVRINTKLDESIFDVRRLAQWR